MSVVTELVSGAPADLPAAVPAGRAAGASCSPGCREPGGAAGAADTPPDDPVLQPAHIQQSNKYKLKDPQTVSLGRVYYLDILYLM